MLGALFFLFGLGIMGWVPRFPEVKHNLDVGNGQFGTLISMGAIGSVISLVAVGSLVHRFGSRKVLAVSATFLFGAIAAIVHITSEWQFLFCNMMIGAGISAFHIAVNSQALFEQSHERENLIPRLHGLWSLGALSTAMLSGLLIGNVPLWIHIDALCAFVYITILVLIKKIGSSSLKASKEPREEYSFRVLFNRNKIDWIMGLGATCSLAIEYAIADWAAIFSKEELHMSAGLSALPYVLFALAMIIGRMSFHHVTEYIGIGKLIRICSLVGGTTFILAILIGVHVSKSSATVGFVIVLGGLFVLGLGDSFLAPSFMHAANNRSKSPGSVVIGQMGAINTSLVLVIKPIIAWTAQITSIAVALIIPATMLLLVSTFARTVQKAND
jgi:MFS family permease